MDESTTLPAKACNRCGETKPLDDYHRHKGAPDGHRAICKDCVNAASRAYNAAHPERRREAVRKWAKANPEAVVAKRRAYYDANAESLNEKARAYRAANPDKVREWKRRDREANSDWYQDYGRRWREANPDKVREYLEANAEKRREQRVAYNAANYDKRRAWLEANADKTRAYANKRRALKVDGDCGCVNSESVAAVIAAYGEACVYCGGAVEHIDHLVPLSRGGHHCVSNLRPACTSCNTSKFTSTLNAFLKRRPELRGDIAEQELIQCPNL